MPWVIFSSERHYLEALFLQGILSAVEDSHMLIRGAVALVTIALKRSPGIERNTDQRKRMEIHTQDSPLWCSLWEEIDPICYCSTVNNLCTNHLIYQYSNHLQSEKINYQGKSHLYVGHDNPTAAKLKFIFSGYGTEQFNHQVLRFILPSAWLWYLF